MPRAVAFSAKQKRAQILDKRAVKRGELDPSERRVSNNSTVADSGPSGGSRYARTGGSMSRTSRKAARTPLSDKGMHTTRLVSTFVALTPEYMQQTRDEAFTLNLPRPIPDDAAIFPVHIMYSDHEVAESSNFAELSCPQRPTFGLDMTKEEVEKNEEEYHARWLKETEAVARRWVESTGSTTPDPQAGSDRPETRGWLRHSPTWFETSLDVWRQLWRVVETSHVLLVLLDARCPPIHLPPSLRSYLQTLSPRKEVILVLTKADLVDPMALEGWKMWMKRYWQEGLDELHSGTAGSSRRQGDESKDQDAGVQVISVTSYDLDLLYADKARHRPDLPSASLAELVEALRLAHRRVVEARHDAERPVRAEIDWELLARGPTANGCDDSESSSSGREATRARDRTGSPGKGDQPLSMGLIGQPNVGKSSLLNALLGETRVKASKTPGKTKHFQTMFWGGKRHVKIVDCPGLVCPSLVGLELQALCGVLPISQIPSLPACITTAAHLLPLERIFRVPMPPSAIAEQPLHRAVPQVGPGQAARPQEEEWTPAMIMEGRAIDRGYITAKTGRPDINRAANSMLRQLAEGKIRWCFYPPTAAPSDRHLGASTEADDGRSDTAAVTPGPSIPEQGRGLWLGDYESYATEKDSTNEPVFRPSSSPESGSGSAGSSSQSDDSNDESELSDDDDDDDEDDEDEDDDGGDDGSVEVNEYRGRGQKVNGGFFAALDMGAVDEEDDEVDG